MIEQGVVMLVQNDPTVKALCTNGGYWLSLPKDPTFPSWCYHVISSYTEPTLGAQKLLTFERWQIDVFSNDGADCMELACAIDDVLNHFYGVLPDPDATYAQMIFRSDVTDFFDTTVRNYRRMLEYELHFVRKSSGDA
jgi:hypothetical protein